jgi:hypothetical protein
MLRYFWSDCFLHKGCSIHQHLLRYGSVVFLVCLHFAAAVCTEFCTMFQCIYRATNFVYLSLMYFCHFSQHMTFALDLSIKWNTCTKYMKQIHNEEIYLSIHKFQLQNQSRNSLKFCKYENWSKICGTGSIVEKLKNLQVTLCYLLQSTVLQIARSESSDHSTFQCVRACAFACARARVCVCERPVSEWPAAAMSYSVVSPQCLEISSPSGRSSAWRRGRSCGEPNLVSKADG